MKNLCYSFFLLASFSFFSFNVVLAQQDTIPPVVTLLGPPTITVPCNEYYNEFGANAIDDTDGTIEVIREGDSVCTYETGLYAVIYSATDKNGNTASVSRLVIVQGDCSLDCGLIDDFLYAAEFNTQNDTTQTHLNTSVTIPVLENDCCSGLFVSITQTANFGTTAVIDGQSIEYTPNEGFIGVDTIHYQTTNWWWTGARNALVIIEVGTTSIQANPVYPSLQIYPNPAKEFLNIDIGTDLASKQGIELLLFNTVGQLQ
ncbi:MAG: immunoglobulin-like domain-containing protein, partial [Chitinophagales bacterium]